MSAKEAADARTADGIDLRELVSEGDHVRVFIPNTAPIGGGEQFETFEVEELTADRFAGVDANFGDTIEVTRDGDGLHLQSGGKSGEVVRIGWLETNEDNIPKLPPKETVYQQGDA